MSESSFYGWVDDPSGIQATAAKTGSLFQVNSRLQGPSQEDVYLWNAHRAVTGGKWRRGAQGIGDCVSWGAELACTHLMALQHLKGTQRYMGEAATEAIYGGCRVEVRNKTRADWQDGAFGYAGAKWVNEYGVLLRANYSQMTGNSEHDLRRYSSKKAKDWGYYGNGGRNDKGKLDTLARQYPVKQIAQIRKVEEAISAIQNGYPITVASMAGFGRMVRNDEGICRISGRWAHQMEAAGVKWLNGKPLFRIFQSWGPSSCSGPDPGIEWKPVSGCSWWTTEEDFAWILRSGDCWSFGDLQGFPAQSIDITKAAQSWFNPKTGNLRKPMA